MPSTTYDTLFIDGRWQPSSGTGVIEVISPVSEAAVGHVPDATTADIDAAVAAARRAFDEGPWPRMEAKERAAIMRAISGALQQRSAEFAQLITDEMGTPVSWSLFGQVFSATTAMDYYAGLAESYEWEQHRSGMFGPAIVRREPIGVVGAIVPWNVPLFVTFLKLGPAFAAGCTVVLKPAPETPLSANWLAEVCAEVGLPAGVLNVVPAGREVGEHLVTHPDVDKISFTGSSAAGKRIAALCGERLRPVTLELGGKSAALILDDADIATVVPSLLPASTMNNGQACVAQTRILAPRSRYDEVVAAFTEAMGALKVGDPSDAATQVGPLVAERQRDRVEGYIKAGIEEGARVTTGGGRPAGLDKGWFVEPTVFADVTNDMRIAQEEIFGPVVSIIAFDDDEDAVSIANDSNYGLSGSVWTADSDRGLDIARRIRTGTFTVNGFSLEFTCPFGGYKESGLGRELGPEGLEAYLETKTISLPQSAGQAPAGA